MAHDPVITVPDRVFSLATESLRYFEKINGDSGEMHARDALDIPRAVKHAELLNRYIPIEGARLLEVGSGVGANLAVWIKLFGIDGYGIEPNAPEWGHYFEASQILLQANGIDENRIISAVGEHLPFEDNSFDIVYSSNVLEHVQDPDKVLQESIRVLRPGGILHFEVPNFMSYFEGHYNLFGPPLLNRHMFAWWVKLRGKDPTFAKTVNTINPVWCRGAVQRLAKQQPGVTLITLGEDIFLERLAKPWTFQMEQSQGRTGSIVRIVQAVNRFNWIGRLIVAAQGFYPIFLTVRKN
jgi:SAM-dependent methyltransferase